MSSIDTALRRKGGRVLAPAERLRQAGFEEAPPLTLQAMEGELPRGRELSFAWLTGTVMTGLTSVLLMGAALYVSFEGQDNYSTASRALKVTRTATEAPAEAEKSDRLRPLARTRSDVEVVQASIRSNEGGRVYLRNQQFTRLDATLAISATALAEDVPEFDPAALATALDNSSTQAGSAPAPQIYSASVEGEVAITTAALPVKFVPAMAIDDQAAAQTARRAAEDLFFEGSGDAGYAYGPASGALTASLTADAEMGIAENVTVMPRRPADPESGGRSERIITIREATALDDALLKNGFDTTTAPAVMRTLANVFPSSTLPADTKLRILTGPSRLGPVPVPYRLSIYLHDASSGEIRHAATAALTDRGGYVIGLAPGTTQFPEEDTEVADVTALPSLYRSIWETGRRHDVDDETITKLLAIFAYEIDLTQKVNPGDGLKLLTTKPETGKPELLYAALNTGSTTRELFRFQADDGSVDYYSNDGETGKRFLVRRPVQGGGRLTSRYGYRVHPIFKTRRLHTGTDLAAPLGTPIYAGGDGLVGKAGWNGGNGRYVEINHVNGYQTTYSHMSRIATGLKAGDRVKQGQVIGYVGSTGNSTGNHLHYEVRINGRTADALSIKLPRDKELSEQSLPAFTQATTQIRELMDRRPQEISAL